MLCQEGGTDLGFKCTGASSLIKYTTVLAHKDVGLSETRVSPATSINKDKTRTRNGTSLKRNLFPSSRVTISEILFLKLCILQPLQRGTVQQSIEKQCSYLTYLLSKLEFI